MNYTQTIATILNYINTNLSPKRAKHCLNVSLLSQRLAKKHNVDPLKAKVAALAHDLAKNKTDKEQIDFFRGKDKPQYFDLICKNSPQLLHGFIAAHIARHELKIEDTDILKAIANHTLGDIKMSVLEKIIFISDAASYERDCRSAKKIRKLAMENMEEAFMQTLRNKIEYVLSEGSWLCPKCIDVWNFYAAKEK